MSQQRDYTALDWVAADTGQALDQALQAVTAYRAQREDSTRLRFCLTYVHQVTGTLRMASLPGPARVCASLELAIQRLSDGVVPESLQDETLEGIAATIAGLADYLAQVRSERLDQPGQLLAMLNEMRALNGQPLASESPLFRPQLPTPSTPGALPLAGEELAAVTTKLRQMYRIALLSLFRGDDPAKQLNYLAKVFARLVKLSAGHPPDLLWKTCIALCEGLLNQSVKLTAAVRSLLRQLDARLRQVVEGGEAALCAPPPQALLQNLLYYVATSGASSRFIGEMREICGLDQALRLDPGDPVLREDLRNAVAELARSEPAARLLVADALALLGFDDALASLERLGAGSSDGDWSGVADAVSGAPTPEPAGQSRLFNDSEEAQEQLETAHEAVLREARGSLELAKESLVEFVASEWRHACLEEVPRLLAEVRGSLRLAEMPRAADVLAICERYVAETLLQRRLVPAWQQLDILADALASVDYYLEQRQSGDTVHSGILDVAEERAASLVHGDAAAAAEEPAAVESPASAAVIPFPGAATALDAGPGPRDTGTDVSGAESETREDSVAAPSADDGGLADATVPAAPAWEVVGDTEVAEAPAASDDAMVAGASAGPAGASDEEIDPEIAEVFIEEAAEVLETLDDCLPEWQQQPEAGDHLATIRRSFHTLKGSGRMVGASHIGELAWSVENMLNRVIDGSRPLDEARIDVVLAARKLVPVMVEAFREHRAGDGTDGAAAALIGRAEALARGEQVPAETGPGTDEPVSVATADDAQETPQPGTTAPTFDADLEEPAGSEAVALDGSVAPEQGEPESDGEPAAAWLAEATESFNAWVASEPEPEQEQESESTSGSSLEPEPEAEPEPEPEPSWQEPQDWMPESEPAWTSQAEDSALLEIFAGEASAHLQALEDFIAHAATLPGPAELGDDLQRALHTLKGSAHMADVMPVAEVVTPVERLVKELRGARLKADDAVLALLAEATLLLRGGIEQLRHTPHESLPEAASFIQRVEALAEQRLAGMEAAVAADEDALAPARLNQFLHDAVEQVCAVGDDLRAWREQRLVGERQHTLAATISQVADAAGEIGLGPVEELAQSLQTLLRLGAEQASPDEYFFTLGERAVDGLVDQLDRLAAQQQLLPDEELLTALQEFDVAPSLPESVPELASVAMPEPELKLEPEPEPEPAPYAGLDWDNVEEVQVFAPPPPPPDAWQLPPDGTVPEMLFETGAEAGEGAGTDEPPEVEEIEFSGLPQEDAEAVDEPPPLPQLDTEPPLRLADRDEEDEAELAEILEIFLEEAEDLLEAIDQAILGWQDEPDSPVYLDDLQRLLHTLKGGARLAGLRGLGNLSHNFETLLINAQQRGRAIDAPFLAEVQSWQDQVLARVNAIRDKGRAADSEAVPEAPESDDAVAEASPAESSPAALHAGLDAGQAGFEPEPEPMLQRDPEPADQAESEPGSPREPEAATPATGLAPLLEEPGTGLTPGFQEVPEGLLHPAWKRGPQEVIKVSSQLIEELVNLAGETSISRARAEEQVSELVFSLDEMQMTVERLQEQVRRLDRETEAQILFRQEQVESEGLEGFDPLEFDRYSLLQQLSRSLLESASDLIDIKSTLAEKARDMDTLLVQQSRINTDLQEGLMRSRMVPFARMVPRLRRIVRQVGVELGREVDFRVDNAEGELDRSVLERIVAPLEHMLRNAVDHGIEPAEQRVAAGKPRQGLIALDLAREGGEVVIRLRDDGRGIDLDAVRAKAIERGLMRPGAQLSDHEVLQFILHAGFSTAREVTQISGRGVGMDVVHSEIKQLGGVVEIDSRPGQGSEFTIRLPFTVSVNRALMVSVAGDAYAIPLNTIEGIVRVSPFELEAYYQPDAPAFEYAGQSYLMRYMGALLHTSARPNLEGLTMPLPVLLVRGSDHAVAVQVDGLMGSREIVVKSLGPQFAMVQGLSGATVLGDGSVVVILDLAAMIRADASQLHRTIVLGHDEHKAVQERPLRVMVVDDSVTVRKVTSRLLERQGMEVWLAKDGMDAITQLQDPERVPDVMLLDIEMPRMDGFEVASRIRHTSWLKELPIIMITSRTGEKHRDRAIGLGVNRYLGKPYQEPVLLDAIYELTGQQPD